METPPPGRPRYKIDPGRKYSDASPGVSPGPRRQWGSHPPAQINSPVVFRPSTGPTLAVRPSPRDRTSPAQASSTPRRPPAVRLPGTLPLAGTPADNTVRCKLTYKADSPLQEGAAILSSPDGEIDISGGTFNAANGHVNNVTFQLNFNGVEEGTQAGSMIGEQVSKASVPVELERPGPPPSTCSLDTSPEKKGSRHRFQPEPLQPEQSINDIYYRLLSPKKRGSPLWIPEVNKQLSIKYQQNGLGIGDVGIISERGSFDSLFNIARPGDDPLAINSDSLPNNFYPLNITRSDIQKYSEFKQGSYVSSPSIRNSCRDDNSSGLTFESLASEGAILTLPDGSNSEDLGNKKKLRTYLSVHGEEMYRCALNEHGRTINNGDLRVVIGHDKTRNWGMAAFSNSLEESGSGSFCLKFRAKDPKDGGRRHHWEASGSAEVKAGPDVRETEALRRGDPVEQQYDEFEYENQTVFVRTENVSLRREIWKKLLSESGAGDIELDNKSPSDPSSSNFTHCPCLGGSSSSPSSSSLSENNSSGGSRSAHLSLSNTLKVHPSNGINEILLNLSPNARMAITGDECWILVLSEEDSVLPPVEQLWQRIKESESFVVCEEDGVVFLESSETQYPLPPTLAMDAAHKIDVLLENSDDFGNANKEDQKRKLGLNTLFTTTKIAASLINESLSSQSLDLSTTSPSSHGPPPYYPLPPMLATDAAHKIDVLLENIDGFMNTKEDQKRKLEINTLFTTTKIAASLVNESPSSRSLDLSAASVTIIQESYKQLAADAASVLNLVNCWKNLSIDPEEWVTPELWEITANFISTVKDIENFADKRSRRNVVVRFFTVKADPAIIAAYRENLKLAVYTYQCLSQAKIYEALVDVFVKQKLLKEEGERKQIEDKEGREMVEAKEEWERKKVGAMERLPRRRIDAEQPRLRKEIEQPRWKQGREERSESQSEPDSDDERIRRRREGRKSQLELARRQMLDGAEQSDNEKGYWETIKWEAHWETVKWEAFKNDDTYADDEEEETAVSPPEREQAKLKQRIYMGEGNETRGLTSTLDRPMTLDSNLSYPILSNRAQQKRTKKEDNSLYDDFKRMNIENGGYSQLHSRYRYPPPSKAMDEETENWVEGHREPRIERSRPVKTAKRHPLKRNDKTYADDEETAVLRSKGKQTQSIPLTQRFHEDKRNETHSPTSTQGQGLTSNPSRPDKGKRNRTKKTDDDDNSSHDDFNRTTIEGRGHSQPHFGNRDPPPLLAVPRSHPYCSNYHPYLAQRERCPSVSTSEGKQARRSPFEEPIYEDRDSTTRSSTSAQSRLMKHNSNVSNEVERERIKEDNNFNRMNNERRGYSQSHSGYAGLQPIGRSYAYPQNYPASHSRYPPDSTSERMQAKAKRRTYDDRGDEMRGSTSAQGRLVEPNSNWLHEPDNFDDRMNIEDRRYPQLHPGYEGPPPLGRQYHSNASGYSSYHSYAPPHYPLHNPTFIINVDSGNNNNTFQNANNTSPRPPQHEQGEGD